MGGGSPAAEGGNQFRVRDRSHLIRLNATPGRGPDELTMARRATRPMYAPTTAELLADPTVLQALDDAWSDSLPGDPARRHEEGGWIYLDTTPGVLGVRRAAAGAQA